MIEQDQKYFQIRNAQLSVDAFKKWKEKQLIDGALPSDLDPMLDVKIRNLEMFLERIEYEK